MKKIVRIKPSYMVTINAPATILISRVWGSLVQLEIDCPKGSEVKWGSRKEMAKKD